MVEVQDPEGPARTFPFRPRLPAVVATAVVVIVGLAVFPSQDPRAVEPASSEALPEPLTEASLLVQPSPVEIAESFMAARNAYDVETIMSLLADDVGTVPETRNRDELAIAFEAEEVYGVRYEPFDCHHDSDMAWAGGDASVTCTYLMDHRLSRIEGYPPVESSFRFRIREDRMALLSFPWLDMRLAPLIRSPRLTPLNSPRLTYTYYPPEFDNFLTWLGVEHPQAVGGYGVESESVERVFGRISSQFTLIVTTESLDLLADYLEEYERQLNS